MRKLIVLCLMLAGCGGPGFFKDYDIGAEKQAVVGGVMVTASNETKVADQTAHVTQQLVYGGISGKVARVAYKEYGENPVKPLFFQDLRYDLNGSDLIVFQDFTLQVLDASSKEIRFKVLSGPKDPNAPDEPQKEENTAPPTFPH